ncbi:ElaD/SseL family deubiquitinase [Providencia sp. Me31A]|uniref:ElaD/SseL family deubiquitinase n=1 Tax=Providencia sp. Me31A TaxID=3392637 RepID=UPI003D2C8818
MAIHPTALSPTQTHYMYGLTNEQFNGLFEKEISSESLNSLATSASEGDLNSIDLLHNIALRQDSEGRKAENILFDLFSGKQSAKIGIDKEIQKTSQKLYQLYLDGKLKKHLYNSKLTTPSKLLYIIGSTIEKCVDKINLTKILMKNEPEGSSLWNNGRMTTSDEIDSINNHNLVLPSNMIINASLGLTQHGQHLLAEIIEQKTPNETGGNQYELFPINIHDNHWILFVLYPAAPQHQSANHKMKCAIFNSYNKIDADIQEEITRAANKADVIEEDITYIEGNIQQHVPNGCGLFVIEAMKQLIKNHQQDPVKVLNKFHQDFSRKTIAEQEQFNTQSRRQLYSTYYDAQY